MNSLKAAKLELFSFQAKRMLQGRAGDAELGLRPIYGLFQFASLARIIWDDATLGNPYALWWLVRLTDRQQSIQLLLDQCQQTVQTLMDTKDVVPFQPFEPGQPMPVDLNLKTPYSWQAARQIKQFDDFCLMAMQVNRVGLMTDREMHTQIATLNKGLLALFSEAMLYHSHALNREQLQLQTDVAKAAMKQMGIVPKAIFTGQLVPAYSPSGK